LTDLGGVGAFLAGAAGRCPACGRGPLFNGFISITPRCAACGHDLAASDSGDGPAVFVIIVVGFIAVFGAMFTEIAFRPPVWVPLAVWVPIAGTLCFALLRPIKGLMIAAHVHNRAARPGGGPAP
jgi:uncharacterized protein (DUF983 family)